MLKFPSLISADLPLFLAALGSAALPVSLSEEHGCFAIFLYASRLRQQRLLNEAHIKVEGALVRPGVCVCVCAMATFWVWMYRNFQAFL